jgi:uroporphyrinogen-III synthase
MEPNKIKILSTRPLDTARIKAAGKQGVQIEELSFIETEAIQSIVVQQEIELALQESATIVFTSMNAVEAVAEYMTDEQPDWAIYCMGNTTLELVKKYFGEHSIAGTAANATELAEQIVEDAVSDMVIFFCGDQRRDELPNILQNNEIEVQEIEVYHTIPITHKIGKQYHGILFFSPSAVDSFFRNNVLPAQTILFAIGNTTATAIKKYCGNAIIIGKEPGKDFLLTTALNYFLHNER